MIVKIEHKVEYQYSESVFLEPHVLRLSPRRDSLNSVTEHNLVIAPQPTGLTENVDLEGSLSHEAWFTEKTNKLSISSSLSIELKERNPFNFITYPKEALGLPFYYSKKVAPILSNALIPLTSFEEIKKYIQGVHQETKGETAAFLTRLVEKISDEWTYEYREVGDPHLPEETFRARKGSCRDIAYLFMAMCRNMGLAARFVSGYFLDANNDNPPELHAWVEVYLPGGGWRGFDPTNGIAVDSRYIPLTASADYTLTAPVSGTFRGKATAEMSYTLNVDQLDKTKVSS